MHHPAADEGEPRYPLSAKVSKSLSSHTSSSNEEILTSEINSKSKVLQLLQLSAMTPSRSPFLPEDYKVGPHDVIIGRGRRCQNNPGNIRFKAIIQATLSSYSNTQTKLQKSAIIMDVLSQVRGEDGVGFVKQDSATGLYTKVEDAASRIAIAQSFRDGLSGTYKSSKKHKQVRRIERMKGKQCVETIDAVSRSIFDDCDDPIPPEKSIEKNYSCQQGSRTATSGISMLQLRGIIQEATTGVDTTHRQALKQSFTSLKPGNIFSSAPQSEHDQSCFSALFSAFASTLDAINNEDPFEPTPLDERCDIFHSLELS